MQRPPPQIFDLVDIRERLQYNQILVKSRGFSSLVEQIISRKLDAKKDIEYKKVLFDCFYEYGDVPLEMLLDVLPILQERQLISAQTILEEFSLRLLKISKEQISRAFPMVINACLPSFSKFLELAARIDKDVMADMFMEEDLQRDHYRYIMVLLYSGLLNDDQKRRLGNLKLVQEIFLQHFPHLYPVNDRKTFDPEHHLRACSAPEMEKDTLQSLDTFQMLRLMHERPAILRNPNVGQSILFTPFMFLMSQYIPHVANVMKPEQAEQMRRLTANKFDECVEQIKFAEPDFFKSDLTMEKMLSHVITKNTEEQFYRFVEYCSDELPMFLEAHFLPGLLALLPNCTENQLLQKNIVGLVVHYLNSAPDHAEEFVNFFIGVYAKAYFPISKSMLLEAFVEMKVDRFALTPIAGFLSYEMARGTDRVGGARALAKLIRKYPWAVQKAVPALKLDGNDPEELFRAKMELAKECCLATSSDDHEIVLGQIEGFIKDNGYRLAATMEIAADLAKNDILDVWTSRNILGRNVKYLGNEAACAAYCRFLAVGANLDVEDCASELEERKKKFIGDLKEFTQSTHPLVATEAWDSLGFFTMEEIQEHMGMVPSGYGEIYRNLDPTHRLGFVKFLNHHLDTEKESYPRSLYNSASDMADVPPLMLKVDTYKDQLTNKYKDEPWFWASTLPMTASILQLTSPSNKATTAVRILKSCLLQVEPATSSEEMICLVARWRICIREMLNVLMESKSNDILWARDQICSEGRMSLAQKNESVDCIMMMLTVLAESIEEKLKNSEDPKFVNEVSTAQKPWLISVLEFCATRLPKEHKEAWIVKANPIYQVKTHSNQSSLHTAMFCCRLLRRIPALTEYYRDLKDPEFGKDPYLRYLLQDSSKRIENDLVVSRYMMYVTAEAYGVSELTARRFETDHQATVEEKTGSSANPSLECNEDIEEFFTQLFKSSRNKMSEIQQQNRKVLEKMWNSGSEDVKMKIYKGLGYLALVSGSGRKKAVVPVEKLSDSSILKGVLQLFDEKLNVPTDALQLLLRVFADHRRPNGRFLPPIDWMKVLERAEWKAVDPETRLSLIKLSCEQNIPDVLFHYAGGDLTAQQVYVIAENLRTVMKLLPRKEFMIILRRITKQARIVDEDKENVLKLSNAVAELEKDPIVHEFLVGDLPKLDDPVQVTDPILRALKDPIAFIGSISRSFDVWAEAHNGDKMNMKRICEYILEETNTLTEAKMYVLLSLEARRLSHKKKIDKILDVITASRIQRSANGDMSKFFPIVLAIIVSLDPTVQISVCFFGTESQTIEMMCAAKRPFFRSLLKCAEMKKHIEHIGSFLRPYVDGEETDIYELWQKTAATDMLRDVIAHFGYDALLNLLHEDDFFWQTILPVE
ncbi:hypothetical protein L3Y34_006131 [Caenorhabditis briggsae]|uniref:Uncharacterized protein n=1 Tax=Caenorhabditis briggsae TaxID=6238 RepID=A0AAE8ZYT9_CAEBR|nr:hypothetical protein L3Y34_006131 [Caenorhabditis briggsae]